jgi:hypothetical protein
VEGLPREPKRDGVGLARAAPLLPNLWRFGP